MAIDLDGTTVRHDLTIAPAVLKAVHQLVHHTPVKVVVATGRMHPSALTYVRQLQTPEPVVSYQGGMVTTQCNQQKTLHHSPIHLPTAQALLAELKADNFNVNVYINNQLYTNHSNDKAAYYAKMAGVEPVLVDDLATVLTAPPTKMMVIDDNRIDELLLHIRATYGDTVDCIRSRTDFCEVVAKNTSKWNAVKLLADDWGIPDESIMAVGDQENDLSMITAAGLGVAMGNAPAWIQAQAKVVAPSIDEDGLAAVLDEYVLSVV